MFCRVFGSFWGFLRFIVVCESDQLTVPSSIYPYSLQTLPDSLHFFTFYLLALSSPLVCYSIILRGGIKTKHYLVSCTIPDLT